MSEIFYVGILVDKENEHELHRASCEKCPNQKDRIFLGRFENSKDAMKKAKEHYEKVHSCDICCEKES